MKRITKRVLSIMLSTVLSASLLFGCSKKQDNENGSKPAESPTASTAPSATEDSGKVSDVPVTFSVLWNGEYNEDFKMIKKMTELTNVSLSVEGIPGADYDTKREVVMASGKMPDIVTRTKSSNSIDALGMSGKLLAVDKYLDKLPHFMAKLKEIGCESIITDNTAADGHMYQFPTSIQEVMNNSKQTMIRKDVFDELGIPVPTTWDEMYDACVKIKEKYPDVYPMQIVYGMGNLLDEIAPAFGIKAGWGAGRNNFCYDASSDNWFFAPTSDQYKAMLQYLNKCYANGILDKEFTTMDGTQFGENMSTNKGFVDVANWLGCETASEDTLHKDGTTNADWQPIYPLAGPSGKPATSPTGWYYQAMVFSADLEKSPNFDTFLKWLDWMYTDEAIDLFQYGVEGETYTRTAEGKIKWTDDVKSSTNPDGTVDMGIVWGVGPTWSFVERPSSNMDASLITPEYTNLLDSIAKNGDYTETDPVLHLSDTDLDQESLVGVALKDYVDMMTEKFILGSESFDNWDTFVKQCNEKGVTSLSDIYNKTWQDSKK